MEEEDKGLLLKKLIGAINEVSSFSDHRCSVKRQFCNLARRLKLLTPMFEEIRDSKLPLSDEDAKSIAVFADALDSAKDFLRFGREASKIYLVLERDQIIKRFHEVTITLEQALDGMNCERLDISDEVKEQVELVLAQFRRAKGKIDPADADLHEDLLSIYISDNETPADPALMKRVTERLQLTANCDLTQEALALHKMATSADSDSDGSLEKMSMLFEKMKDFILTENPSLNSASRERNPSSCSGQASTDGIQKSVVIPDDFRCPISLELMRDPVIVSTGQTYERSCIEKWLEAGHSTCPKTQQTLTSSILTPNYVLRSLIAQWCEANGLEPPKRPSNAPGNPTPTRSPAERAKIEALLSKLTSTNPEDQRSAAGEIRLLAKRNADNRVAIAEAGAIPLLVSLLTIPDSRTQEHAVTALLNLSICENNKGAIVSTGAVPGIVHVLKKGSMEARENAAATLFSLSVIDENKVAIGSSGAIPPLVTLLNEGTQRGKKDAATALFNLCIYQGNKGKAVRAGVVPILMRLLTEPGGGMMDESLAILAILASHQEGKSAIAGADALPVLVDVIGNGSPRNKENAAAVLVHLYSGDSHNMVAAQELGVMGPLAEMAQNGTERGKRKAVQLLERMSRYFAQLKPAQPQEEAADG